MSGLTLGPAALVQLQVWSLAPADGPVSLIERSRVLRSFLTHPLQPLDASEAYVCILWMHKGKSLAEVQSSDQAQCNPCVAESETIVLEYGGRSRDASTRQQCGYRKSD